MPNPKYSLIEIEKRWLVNKDKLPDISQLKKIEVTDKYFPGTRTRLRKMLYITSNEIIYKLTKKYGKTSDYSEPLTTLYLNEAEYNIYNKLEGKILVKNIYHYHYKGKKILIGIFIKPQVDFIIMEAEASSESELHKLTVPDFVIKEVTNEKKYEGSSISLI